MERKGAPTKYGRQELHVTSDASARFKKKQMQSRSRRHVSVSVESRGGVFAQPTAPVVPHEDRYTGENAASKRARIWSGSSGRCRRT